MISYTKKKDQQQRAVVQKLLLTLQELDTYFLYITSPMELYYGEDMVGISPVKKGAVEEFKDVLAQLKQIHTFLKNTKL